MKLCKKRCYEGDRLKREHLSNRSSSWFPSKRIKGEWEAALLFHLEERAISTKHKQPPHLDTQTHKMQL